MLDSSRIIFSNENKTSKNDSMNYIINKLIKVCSIITDEFIAIGSIALYEQFKQLPIDTTIVTDSQLMNVLFNANQKLPPIKNKDVIPKNLFQIFIGFNKDTIPIYIREMIKKYSKGYKYHLYDDKKSLAFLKKYFSEKVVQRFHDLKVGAHKADLLRYCLLYIYGGVYLDIKTIILKPLDEIFSHNYFYSVISVFEYTIHQGVIASKPNNILFLKLIWYIVNVKLSIVNIGRRNYLSFCRDMYEKIRKDTKLKKLENGVNKGSQDTYYLFEEKCENLLLSDCAIYDNFKNKNKVFVTRDPNYPWVKK